MIFDVPESSRRQTKASAVSVITKQRAGAGAHFPALFVEHGSLSLITSFRTAHQAHPRVPASSSRRRILQMSDRWRLAFA